MSCKSIVAWTLTTRVNRTLGNRWAARCFDSNGALLHNNSRQQTVVATSSAEAEYYGIGGGLVETVGLLNALGELKQSVTTRVRSASCSGRALACKVGYGRTKPMDVKMAWIQPTLLDRDIKPASVTSTANVADIGTKSLSKDRLTEQDWFGHEKDIMR